MLFSHLLEKKKLMMSSHVIAISNKSMILQEIMVLQIMNILKSLDPGQYHLEYFQPSEDIVTILSIKHESFAEMKKVTSLLVDMGYIQTSFFLSPCFTRIYQQFQGA